MRSPDQIGGFRLSEALPLGSSVIAKVCAASDTTARTDEGRNVVDSTSPLEQLLFEALRDYVDALEDLPPAVEAPDAASWLESLAGLGAPRARLTEAINSVSKATGLQSATARLLAYLKANVGKPVSSDSLAMVAGIGEWARRIRELRVEAGYDIRTHLSDPDLGPSDYLLASVEPDEGRAERWQTVNEIRNDASLSSAQKRLLALLKYLAGRPATAEELQEVARVTSYARRLRELREQGWQIEGFGEDPSVPFGGYRLASSTQHQGRMRRAIAERYRLLEEANFSCKDCGASSKGEVRVRLQVHHMKHVRHGGDNSDENLRVLCSHCHAGVHSLHEGSVTDELISPGSDPYRRSRDD